MACPCTCKADFLDHIRVHKPVCVQALPRIADAQMNQQGRLGGEHDATGAPIGFAEVGFLAVEFPAAVGFRFAYDILAYSVSSRWSSS
jgi:hypothetical protein